MLGHRVRNSLNSDTKTMLISNLNIISKQGVFVVRLLKLSGCFVIQSTVRSPCVIESKVLGNALTDCCIRAVSPASLHGREKGFNYCIVVRLTGTMTEPCVTDIDY